MHTKGEISTYKLENRKPKINEKLRTQHSELRTPLSH